jgi:hypothetical protein
MATQYTDWLLSLGGRNAPLPPCDRRLAVTHFYEFPGNVTTATLSGSVKASPDATTELAVFTIGTPVFDPDENVTRWAFSLPAGTGSNSTGALPADGNGDGVVYFVYDLLLTLSGGVTRRVAGGLFPVSGFVTEV